MQEEIVAYDGTYRLPDMSPEAQTRVWQKNYTTLLGSYPPDEDHLKYALTQLKFLLQRHFRRFRYKLWSHEEVMQDFDPDSLAGSPGFPFNAYYQSKRAVPDHVLQHYVSKLETSLFEGYNPCISQLFAKTELVKAVKVEEDDQRCIAGNPYDHTYLCKKYWGEFLSNLKTVTPNHPWMLGLVMRSTQWTSLRWRLTRGGAITKFLIADIVGFEKCYNSVYLRGIIPILLDFIPPQHKVVAEQLLKSLDEILLRGSNGIVTKLINFNGSGHPFTTILNNFVMFLLIMIAVSMCTGKFFIDWELLMELAIYGDDAVIAITDELIEAGFTIAGFKAALASIGVKTKIPDQYLPFSEVDFLSHKWVRYEQSPFFGPSPTRGDKIKLSLLTRLRKMSVPQHFMKIAQIRELVCFNDELWGYAEAVTDLFSQKYEAFYGREPDWQEATRLLHSREALQLRTLGLVLSSRRSETIKENMPKTKKIAKKVERKVVKAIKAKVKTKGERKTQPKAKTGKTRPANYNYKNMNYSSMNEHRPGPSNASSNKLAKDYVYCLLQPWDGYVRGLNPVVPDGNMSTTTTIWTKTVLNLSTCNNAATGTQDLCVRLYPFGVSHYEYVTTITAGVPAASTTGNATNYSSWGTSFDAIRCVCLGAQVRNTQAAGSESGDIVQWRAPFNVVNNTWGYFANQNDAVLRGLTKPGDMGLMHWRPTSSSLGGDRQFKPPAATPSSYSTAGSAGTCVGFWAQCSTAATFEVTVYAAWEARVLATASGLFDVQTNCADPAEANKLLMKALTNCPDYCQERVVVQDDGGIEAIIEDGKAIYGGLSGAWDAAKRIGGAIAGWFGLGQEHPKLRAARIMEHFREQDETVFQQIVDYIQFNPRCTVADMLAYFYEQQPSPVPPAIGGPTLDALQSLTQYCDEHKVTLPQLLDATLETRRSLRSAHDDWVDAHGHHEMPNPASTPTTRSSSRTSVGQPAGGPRL